MKKLNFFLFLSFVIFFSQSSMGQWNMKAFYGYGFGILKNEFTTKIINNVIYPDGTEPRIDFSTIRHSLGEGSQTGVEFNYNFRKIPALFTGFGLYYTHGNTIKGESDLNYDFYNNSVYFAHLTGSYTMKGRLISLAPILGYSIRMNRFRAYSEIGPNLNFVIINENTEISTHVTLPGYWPFETINSRFHYQRNLTVGGMGALGIDYTFADGISLFCESRGTFVFYFPKKGRLVGSLYEGNANMNNLTTSQKEFEFLDEYDPDLYDPNSQNISLLLISTDFVGRSDQKEDQPTQMAGKTFSFCNISVNLGFRIRLGS
jgi:hypothetical protein